MPNQIPNASLLDGVTGYTGGGALGVFVDGIGAPARPVIEAVAFVLSTPVDLADAAGVFAFSHHTGSRAAVRFATPGGDVDVTLPIVTTARGAAYRGIAGTFTYSRGYVAAPAGATAWSLLIDGPGRVAVFRPYGVGTMATAARACGWSPGPHLNPDLALPSWPEELPAPQGDSFEVEPIPLRKAFTSDDGSSTLRRVASRSRRYVRFDMRLDAVARDVLETFWRENVDEFFYVRPDTQDLCIAEWMDDGDPADKGGRPGSRTTSVRFLIREA